MICKYCKNEIPDESVFCMICGERVARKKREKKEVRIPKPTQLADKTWSAQLMVNGIRVRVKGETLEEYYAKASATKAGLIEAQKPDNRLVSSLVSEYIAIREGKISPATIDGYLRKSKNNLQSLYGLKLKDLTKEKVQAAIDEDSKKYSGKSIWSAWTLVKSATGVDYDDLVFPSKKPKKKPPVYTSDDLRKLVLALADIGGQVECAGLLAAWMSLRRSEIMGLRWCDVFPAAIRIQKARVYDKSHKLVEKDTKTDLSERIIPCDAYILTKLNALPHEGDRVFTMSTSGIWKGITTACDRAGIEHGYLHGLRHTNASVMELLGIGSVYANRRGGWSSDHVRRNTYVAQMPEGDIETAQQVDNYFLGLITYGPPKPS